MSSPGGTTDARAPSSENKANMKRPLLFIALFALIAASRVNAQPPADPYKPVLDRLQAITTLPVKDWTSQPAAMAHCEEASDSPGSPSVPVGTELVLPACLRVNVEIPGRLNGYALK